MSPQDTAGSPSASPVLQALQIATQQVQRAIEDAAAQASGARQLTKDDFALTNPTPEETK